MTGLFSTTNMLLPALSFLVVLASAQVVEKEPIKLCQHGLSANDIAANSGLDLTGKTALVTGGRSGLGFAISEALVRQNCTVILASRNEEANQNAVNDLVTLVPGANVSYYTFDLEDFSSVRALASILQESAPDQKLDYYFANAGRGSESTPITIDGYDRIFQTNYVGQFLLLELLMPMIRASDTGRILLTGSSSHSLACGNLFLSNGPAEEDDCFADTAAMDMMPFDQAGLDAVNNTFGCPPLASTYPLTKYLFVQLAREIAKREAGNNVYAYAWAPGNIRTDLNPWASCCVGPTESFGPTCRYQLPYVGPTDDLGNPNPPEPAVPNHWSSPAHGAMSAIYAALHADTKDAGKFFATYWECEPDRGYFEQGMTDAGREELFQRSREWAGMEEGGLTTDPDAGNVANETGDEPPAVGPGVTDLLSSGTRLWKSTHMMVLCMGLVSLLFLT